MPPQRHPDPVDLGNPVGHPPDPRPSIARRLLAEFVGTALLVAAVVGSGIMATTLSPRDVGLQLLENVLAIVFALGALILVFGPVSGAHFNPLVSAADWFLGRRTRSGLTTPELAGYAVAQFAGAVAGSVLANRMFALPAVSWSRTDRLGAHLWLGEIVATAGLILLVFALARAGTAKETAGSAPGASPPATAAAVAAYIGAAAWFTSSTSFVNPALTVARAFTDTFTGISPRSLPGFLAAQVVGLAVGIGLLLTLYPTIGRVAGRVVVPTTADRADPNP